MRFPAFVLSVAVLLFGLVFTAPHDRVYAATTTSSPGMTAAIAGVVAATAAANGFVANDPRIAETVKAIGASAAALGASIAAAAGEAVGAVPWIAVGAAAGIGAVLAGVPTSLGDDSMAAWQFNSDGTVTVNPSSSSQGSGGSGSSPFPALTPGQSYWQSLPGVGSSPDAAAQAAAQAANVGSLAPYNETEIIDGCTYMYQGEYQCAYHVVGSDGSPHGSGNIYAGQSSTSWTGAACASGLVISGACTAYVPPPSFSSPSPVTESVDQTVAGVPADDLSEPLNPALLAALVGALWSQAAEDDGYSGLPYPVNAPPTSGQAQDVETSLGGSAGAPSVGSVTSGSGTLTGANPSDPFSMPAGTTTGTGTGTGTSTGTGTGTTTATDPGSGAQVNLGPDPGIGAPSLESIPTAAQILAPLLGLMSDLKAWAVPAHTSQCPEPSFDLWGTTYTFTTQCDLLEQYGSGITIGFEVAFAVAAVLTVLTA
ncbi:MULTISPECIES: hypothetical protein [Paraburkholderia]|uniref:hypothetical protein n=1 Tax=Paraburkholderia TaxID=1822464 RepID=UPI0013A70967|nr:MULTISPECIES: hypothetical protein [Paraburkholderia]MDH6146084.1 hypothetical protein [Paraburkholderia sp. WSM4179]